MIRYLRHKDIDKQAWDRRVQESSEPRIYGLSGYLDRCSPRWDAMIWEDYRLILPLPVFRRWGLKGVRRPVFSQQLGPFAASQDDLAQLGAMIDNIPSAFKKVEISLIAGTQDYLHKLPYRLRMNYVLELKGPQSWTGCINENTRRNIRKANGYDLHLERKLDVGTLVSFKKQNEQVPLNQKLYHSLKDILHYVLQNDMGMSWGVSDKNGDLLSAVFFLKYRQRYYYLVSASNAEGKDKRSMFYLMEQFLEQEHEKGSILDFEGSDVPGVARFFQGFGARPEPYPHLRINRLPWPFK